MDTKLKKSKTAVSFMAFFLGINLLIGSVVRILDEGFRYGWGNLNLKDAFLENYQETEAFRSYIGGCLEAFLSMAAGGTVFWPDRYGGGYLYDDASGTVSEVLFEGMEPVYGYGDTVTSEITTGYGTGSVWDEAGYSDDYEEWYGDMYGQNGEEDWEESDEERLEYNRKMAQKLDQWLKDDKNMLYRVSFDGEVLYTNAGDARMDGAAGSLPEDYNFLLYFNGEKVRILRDGREEDVYGDGYYRESSRWYVPGYLNFTLDEKMRGAEVAIAVAAEPVLYQKGVYGHGGYREYSSTLYWMQRNRLEDRGRYLRIAGETAAAVLCMAVYFLLRKSRKAADAFLGRLTGKLWFEAKLLLLAAVTAGCFFLWLYGCIEEVYWQWEQAVTYEFINDSETIRQISRLLLTGWNAAGVAVWFWTVYLFVNDIRQTRQTWKHGIVYKLKCFFDRKLLKEPLSRKIIFRSGVMAGACVLYGGASFLAVFAGSEYGYDHPAAVAALIGVGFAALMGILISYMKAEKRTVNSLELLSQRIARIYSGNYESGGECPEDAGVENILRELDDIREGMETAVNEQMKSQRMKVELIANVSHDIKTPLTSIISYVQFLKEEEDLPDHVKDYIRILDDKSQRLKNMVQDVFAVSKAASGELPVNMETLDFGKLLRQTLADMGEQIDDSAVTFKTDIPDRPVFITADGQRLYRVFQNLFQNAIKYSLEGSRIYVTLVSDETSAEASVKNTSRAEIDGSVDFAERFTRGDESRTDGGSGLGLSIAQSFTEACGGSFRLETIADLFVVTVTFPLQV